MLTHRTIKYSHTVSVKGNLSSHLVTGAPWTQSVDFIKEDHARSRVSSSLEDLPDRPLTLAYVLHTQTHSVQCRLIMLPGSSAGSAGQGRDKHHVPHHVEQLGSLHRDEVQARLVGHCLSGKKPVTVKGRQLPESLLQEITGLHRSNPNTESTNVMSHLPSFKE